MSYFPQPPLPLISKHYKSECSHDELENIECPSEICNVYKFMAELFRKQYSAYLKPSHHGTIMGSLKTAVAKKHHILKS